MKDACRQNRICARRNCRGKVGELAGTSAGDDWHGHFAANHLDEERKVKPSDERDAAADVMLDELLRVTSLLRPAAFS